MGGINSFESSTCLYPKCSSNYRYYILSHPTQLQITSEVLSSATTSKVWNLQKGSKLYTADKRDYFWEMDWKQKEYLTGSHLGGTRLQLLVSLFCVLLGTVLQDVLVRCQFVPHWEERKSCQCRKGHSLITPVQTVWITIQSNSNYKHEKTVTLSQKYLCTVYLTISLLSLSQHIVPLFF